METAIKEIPLVTSLLEQLKATLKVAVDYDDVSFSVVDGLESDLLFNYKLIKEELYFPVTFSLNTFKERGVNLYKPFVISDMKSYSRSDFDKYTRVFKNHSLMIMPIIKQDYLTGLFAIGHRKHDYYTPMMIEYVQDFVKKVTPNIVDAIFLLKAMKQAEELQNLLNFHQTITNYSNRDTILQEVTSKACKFTSSNSAVMYLAEGKYFCPAIAVGEKQLEDYREICVTEKILSCRHVVSESQLFDSMGNRIVPGDADNALCVPITANDRTVGLLVTHNKKIGIYGSRDEEILTSLAKSTTVGIKNILNCDLDLCLLQERQRIAQSLHNTLGQLLFAVGIEVKKACGFPSLDQKVTKSLNNIRKMIDRSNKELRSAIFSLHNSSYFKKNGLVELIKKLLDKFEKQCSAKTSLIIPDIFPELGPEKSEVVYRIVNEALTNIYKHAQASKVAVNLNIYEGWLILTVKDNGIGFSDLSLIENGEEHLHFGIASMHRLAEQANGTISIYNNGNEGGATVEAYLPIDGKH